MRPSLLVLVTALSMSAIIGLAQNAPGLPNHTMSGPKPDAAKVAQASSPQSAPPSQDLASEKSMQVLEVASKNVDMSSALVAMASYILGALAILLALATLIIQVVGAASRKRAVDAAIKRTLDGLATNSEFAEQVLQEIIQKENLKEYIIAQIDQAVKESADVILTQEYFESKRTELGIRWEEFSNNQKSGAPSK